jgi:muramoyltetrapeptide carboxypeptidase
LRLERGDTVGVVSPGFRVKPPLLRAGVRRLESMGFTVRLGRHVLEGAGYLAGDDEARAADLTAMLRDPEVRGVWFARGGYGTIRLLDRIPWRAVRRDPKLLIGYSDLTALFAALARLPEQRCLYGPVVTELGDPASYDRASLGRMLRGESIRLRIARGRVLAPGRARGRLLGGNLTVLNHLLGTRFEPDLRESILFLEDVGEPVYRLDRMLTQLELAGALKGLAGVLLGHLSAPARRRFPPDRDLAELLGEIFRPLGVPVVQGLPAGHVPRKRTLPLGGRAELDTEAGRLRLIP